jgi:hypothetical protein
MANKKPPKRTVELQPPIGGVVLAYAYQNQAPFTCPDALNVRPYDVAEMRARIGTRPGLEKAFAANVGPGEVRMMATVQWKSSNQVVSTLVVSAAGVTKYSNSSGALASVGGAGSITSSQLVHAVDLSQKLYIADWDPNPSARSPKVYDPSGNTLAALTATAGTVPTGNRCIARYRGRIVLAGADNTIYGSRVNDPTDWDTGADVDDQNRPWVIGAEDAFCIGEPATALIPTNDQCMLIGTYNSLWIMRNDPTSGGSLNQLDAKIGPVQHGAWCYAPGGAVVFLSRDGLYMTYGGCADHRVEQLSRPRLPEALLNIGSNKIVNLAFDLFANGVHIFVSPVIEAYTTGTIEVVNGVATLTGGTWPSDAADKILVVGGSNYAVSTRDSGTQLTLVDTTLDVAAGSSYALVQETTGGDHYFFDWKNKGFWPVSYGWANECTCICDWQNFAQSGSYSTAYTAAVNAMPVANPHPTSTAHAIVASESMVLIGGRDGNIRWHRTDASDDDGEAIDSYMVYGPFGFGRGFYDCSIDSVHLTKGGDSGDFSAVVQAGPSPEQALNDPYRVTDAYHCTEDFPTYWWHPRIVGSDFYLKLTDLDGDIWMIERVGFVISERGLSRGG